MSLTVKISNRKAGMVSKREGVNEKSGRSWTMRSQPVSIYFSGEDDGETYVITLPDDCLGYPAGIYSLDLERHIVRGNFDSLSFARGIKLDFVSNLDGSIPSASVIAETSSEVQSLNSASKYGLQTKKAA